MHTFEATGGVVQLIGLKRLRSWLDGLVSPRERGSEYVFAEVCPCWVSSADRQRSC
jgi:hypothetical protein